MLGVAAVLDQEVVEEVEHVLAHGLQLLLDFLAVSADHLDFFSLPSAEVFCSMLEMTRQEERRAPTTFL